MGSSQNIKSYTDIFYDALPYYLSIGMTASEFWEGDVFLTEAYYEANVYKKKQINEFMHLQGFYVYQAVATVVSNIHFDKRHHKANSYMSEPLNVYMTKEERIAKKRIKEEKEKQAIVAYLNELAKNWENKSRRTTEDGNTN